MSDLSKCPDCRCPVSPFALSCPKCGRILLLHGLEGFFVFAGIVVLVGIVWFVAKAC